MPAEDAREDPTEEHADTSAARGDEADDTHCLRDVGRLGKEGHHQREAGGRDDRAAESLQGAGGDEDRLR